MKRWTVALAALTLTATTVGACGSDEDDVDVPGVSTPIDETIDSAVDSMVDSVTDTEIETDDTTASMDSSVPSTRPPTAGGSPGTTMAGGSSDASTPGASTSNP